MSMYVDWNQWLLLWLIVVISIVTDEYIHWEQFALTVPEDEDIFIVVLAKSNQFYKRSKH